VWHITAKQSKGKRKVEHLYSATIPHMVVLLPQTEPAYSLDRSPSPRSRTLARSHAATRNPSLPSPMVINVDGMHYYSGQCSVQSRQFFTTSYNKRLSDCRPTTFLLLYSNRNDLLPKNAALGCIETSPITLNRVFVLLFAWYSQVLGTQLGTDGLHQSTATSI